MFFLSHSRAPIHIVMTGSSSELRCLAFGKYPFPQTSFPNYTKKDLNTTKFQPVWIYPFVEPSDFRAVYNMMEATRPMSEVYAYSGNITMA